MVLGVLLVDGVVAGAHVVWVGVGRVGVGNVGDVRMARLHLWLPVR